MGIEDSESQKTANFRDYLDRKAQAHREFDEQSRVFDQELEDLARQLFDLIPSNKADLIKETIMPNWLPQMIFSQQELELLTPENSKWLEEKAQATRIHEGNCMRKWLAELENASNNNQKVTILIEDWLDHQDYDLRCKSMEVLAKSWAGIIDIEIEQIHLEPPHHTAVTFKLIQ